MRRREFIALMGASVTWPFAALAQEPGRTYRLGCLYPPPRVGSPGRMFFFDELQRRGFIEGQNLSIEYRAYGQHLDLIPQYATELVKARVDVIATAGDEAVRSVQQVTKTIPIVALVSDMLGSGLVTSLARPDGNTTGVSILAFESDGKRQSGLKWSSQHPDEGGCDEDSKAAFGSVWAGAIVVARSTLRGRTR